MIKSIVEIRRDDQVISIKIILELSLVAEKKISFLDFLLFLIQVEAELKMQKHREVDFLLTVMILY